MNDMEIDNLSKDELLDIVRGLDAGTLLWKKYSEDIFENYIEMIPMLKNIKELNILNEERNKNNLLIEADNYEGLGSLVNIYKNKIDFIYIDPPYNTGNDFIYKDKLVATDDPFKHSKWLSFMEPRLRMAYDLLSKEGVLICSINHIELEYLKLLFNKIFKKQNTEILVWHKPVKMKQTNTFKDEHEYLIVGYKDKKETKLNRPKRKGELKSTQLSNPDNDVRGPWHDGELTKTKSKWNKDSKKYYSVKNPNGKLFEAEFTIYKQEYEILEKDNRIFWTKNGNGLPRRKMWPNEPKERTPSTVLSEETLYHKGFTQTDGNKDLENIFRQPHQEVFEFPKPVELIKWLIETCSSENSIILDFFAGSGTTAQAVLELNRDLKSSRKFILITNNENNIATDVTYKRIKKVINGFKGFVTKEQHEKCDENLLYYRIEPVSNNKIDFSLRELAKKSPDTLFLIENTPIKKVVKNDYQIYTNCLNSYTLVLFDHNKLTDALSHIPNSKIDLNLYLFTLDLEIEITAELKSLESKHNLKVIKFPLKMSSPKF